MNRYIISGGISGAITEPYSPEARKHSVAYYEEIRHRTDDIEKIAENTGFTPDQVKLVKKYLFFDTHLLGDEERRFHESFQIAETWQRLADFPEYIQEHDKLLIPHELTEFGLICKGLTQEKAHQLACEEYNYQKSSDKFYKNLKIERRIYKTKELEERKNRVSIDYDDLEL